MRRFGCVLLVFFLLFPCFTVADAGWADANLPHERLPEEIEIIPWDQIPPALNGQHHYLLLCIDQWHSIPRPKDIDPPTGAGGVRRDLYGNTDGIVILTLDTRAKRIMLTSIIRDAIIRKPNSTETSSKFGRINYVYNDYGPEALCKTISEHLGIPIEKYILFNFGQIQDIIDLESFDGVDIELNSNEISYLARYAVPRWSVVKSDGYFSSRGSEMELNYTAKSGKTYTFSISADAFLQNQNGQVSDTVSFAGIRDAQIAFNPNSTCIITAADGTSEQCHYSFKASTENPGTGLLEIMRGPDVWHNARAETGLYHFRGHPAVLYMRIRKADSQGDFMRTQRVRNVLSALADKCRAFTLDQANELANNIMNNNDATNMTLKEMLDAASFAYSLRDCTIEELRIPASEDVRAILFANMTAQEVNWPSARLKLADFLEHTKLTRDIDFLVSDDEDD